MPMNKQDSEDVNYTNWAERFKAAEQEDPN